MPGGIPIESDGASECVTLYVINSGVPLCLALVGFLPLAMLGADGQMGNSGAGGPFVYLW